MQAGLQAMVLMDRLWGNSIIDPSLKASPHPLIARLRHKGNILRSYMINGWAVVSHEDVKALLRDKRLSSEVFESALIQRRSLITLISSTWIHRTTRACGSWRRKALPVVSSNL